MLSSIKILRAISAQVLISIQLLTDLKVARFGRCFPLLKIAILVFAAFHECGAANVVTEKLPEKHDIAKIISTNILTHQFEHSWPP